MVDISAISATFGFLHLQTLLSTRTQVPSRVFTNRPGGTWLLFFRALSVVKLTKISRKERLKRGRNVAVAILNLLCVTSEDGGELMFKKALVACSVAWIAAVAISPAQARNHRAVIDANGNSGVSVVQARSGIKVRVARSAQAKLQCVVNYVESRGVRIVSMRGVGPGTVSGSLHPSGQAIDINQHARDVTYPRVPRDVANAAADRCGVVSGARWRSADNGHWNLKTSYAGHRHRYRLAYGS